LFLVLTLACGASDAGGPTNGRVPPRGSGTAATGATAGSGGSVSFGGGTSGGVRAGSSAPIGGRNAMECASAMVNTSTATPDILFVIDGSGSMCETFGGSTRWQALRSALLDPQNGLIYQLQANVWFGMVLYDGTIDVVLGLLGSGQGVPPVCSAMYTEMKATGECPQLIDVPIAVNNAAAIDMAFPATELGGSTPTDRAMAHAVDQMIGRQNSDPDGDPHPQYIILATDGAPNDICVGGMGGDGSMQRAGVISAVDRAAAAGITTFVISLAGGDAALQMHLDEVARHGQPNNPAATTFTPMTPQDLVATLAALLGGAIGCEVVLNGTVVAGRECSGLVELNGNGLPCCREENAGWTCDEAPVTPPDGWRLKDERTVELMGATCTQFLLAPAATLRASFPCGVFSPD
jgi:hypothetical protein